MSRISNWPGALVLFLQEKEHAKFQWGENDCCLFTCDWIAILTGEYPEVARSLRGTYHSHAEAVQVLTTLGGVEAIAAQYAASKGWQQLGNPRQAQRGDIAAVRTQQGVALGVVVGWRVAHPGTDGLVWTTLDEALSVWRIS